MTALEWDKTGDRRYETGVDRGVLYLPSGEAVPWNGLVSVSEVRSREVKSYFIDGIKYLDKHIPGSYKAKLQAFTYPDELDELLGTSEYSQGVFVHDQRIKLFNLVYRTLVGNDVEGTEHGYKIHIVYNVLASPSDYSYGSIAGDVSLTPFEWDLSGTPNIMFGIRPTSHISLDSRRIPEDRLTLLEDILFGKAPSGAGTAEDPLVQNDPELPGMIDLLTMVEEP